MRQYIEEMMLLTRHQACVRNIIAVRIIRHHGLKQTYSPNMDNCCWGIDAIRTCQNKETLIHSLPQGIVARATVLVREPGYRSAKSKTAPTPPLQIAMKTRKGCLCASRNHQPVAPARSGVVANEGDKATGCGYLRSLSHGCEPYFSCFGIDVISNVRTSFLQVI